MQIRQVLTDPVFLHTLNEARTETARTKEIKRLTEYGEKLVSNIQKLPESQRFDVGFLSIRAFHDSQYVLNFLYELTETVHKDSSLTNDDLLAILRNFFFERAREIENTRVDYFPALPTDANNLLWQLAEKLGPHWGVNGKEVPAVMILIPTLKTPKYPNETCIKQLSDIILDDNREYAISLLTYLNRAANNTGAHFYNPVLGREVTFTESETVRLAAAFSRHIDPLKLRHNNMNTHLVTHKLAALNTETAEILKSKTNLPNYYEKDAAHYEALLGRPWLLDNLPLLFSLMGHVPACHLENYVNILLQDKDINKITKNVNERQYYSEDDNRNAAVLYFFLEIRRRKRDHGFEYNNYIPQILSFFSSSLADRLAFSKTTKDAAIVMCQDYLISVMNKQAPLNEQALSDYFTKMQHQQHLKALKDGETGKIYKQICILGGGQELISQPVPVTSKQGIFAEPSKDAVKVAVVEDKEDNKAVRAVKA